ncbi:hypothetical protein [Nonomuraea sp. NPDC001023]|uniref:hypothetical protein n=1 Tax=unclassified Nonomuraea TaxID=2593643 RepID=UPI003323C386
MTHADRTRAPATGRRSAAGRAKKGSPTPLTAALTTPSSNVGAVATCRSAGFDEREPTRDRCHDS